VQLEIPPNRGQIPHPIQICRQFAVNLRCTDQNLALTVPFAWQLRWAQPNRRLKLWFSGFPIELSLLTTLGKPKKLAVHRQAMFDFAV
jgi:hypothetical protein